MKAGASNLPDTNIETPAGVAEQAITVPESKSLWGMVPAENLLSSEGRLAEISRLLNEGVAGSKNEYQAAVIFRNPQTPSSKLKEVFNSFGILSKISLMLNLLSVEIRLIDVFAAPRPPATPEAKKSKKGNDLEEAMERNFLQSESWKDSCNERPYTGWSISFLKMNETGEEIVEEASKSTAALPAPSGVTPQVAPHPAMSAAPKTRPVSNFYSDFAKYIIALVNCNNQDALFNLRSMHLDADVHSPDPAGDKELCDLLQGQRVRFVINAPDKLMGGAGYILEKLAERNFRSFETFDGLLEYLHERDIENPSPWFRVLTGLVDEMQQVFKSKSLVPACNEIISLMSAEDKKREPLGSRALNHEREMRSFAERYDLAVKKAAELGY